MLKKISSDNLIILKNLSFLSVLRFFNIGVKFLLVAYLVRTLGKINYGVLTWVDSTIQYFIIFINFGFNVYAAKYIVENRDSKSNLNTITSGVFTVKAILFVLSFGFLFVLTFLNTFAIYKNYLLLMLLMGIGEVFFPIWYFQGVEKLKLATYITITSRLILVIGTLFFVLHPEDLVIHIYLIIFTSFLMGLLGYFTLVKMFDFKFIWVGVSTLSKLIKEAYMFFLGRFLSLTFNFMTIFLIGIYYTMDYVTGFDIALKIVLVCIIPFDMLQQAVFPTITRTKNKTLIKKLIFGSLFFGFFLSFILYFFSTELLQLFGGKEVTSYSSVLETLSIIPPFVALTFILGTCTLVAFGYNKQYNQSLIISSLIYIIIVLFLYLFDILNFWNLVYLRVFSDIILALIRVFYVFQKRIL
ncbi:oligosaccharide flippase family protein [Polaribacter aestuariivivens]|uniref:oligosaccharide flippase family protein n=1 Tax=Polaribacter aestuariivivens TaxID=2304626 RepID=UPI003F49B0C0